MVKGIVVLKPKYPIDMDGFGIRKINRYLQGRATIMSKTIHAYSN